MAGFDYGAMQTLAGNVIGQFKQGVTGYIVVTPGAGPIERPGSPVEAAPFIFPGVARGVMAKYVIGGLAVATDLQCTCAGNALGAIVPKLGDKIAVDGVKLTIVNIVKKPPAGVVVAYTFIIRKG